MNKMIKLFLLTVLLLLCFAHHTVMAFQCLRRPMPIKISIRPTCSKITSFQTNTVRSSLNVGKVRCYATKSDPAGTAKDSRRDRHWLRSTPAKLIVTSALGIKLLSNIAVAAAPILSTMPWANPISAFVRSVKHLFMQTTTASTTPMLSPLQAILLWTVLTVLTALLTSAECAITKISPWKVQEFAEQEGPTSPFATFPDDLTSLLITIMLFSTATSIYKTALLVSTLERVMPQLSLAVVTATLTAFTLFFEELVPTSIAVANSEVVTRACVPLLSRVATVLRPVTSAITSMNALVLRMVGLKAREDNSVSEDMLRRVVDEAERSEQGILTEEGRMIKAVLDMQEQSVGRIMQPRVDIVALPLEATASTLLRTAVLTKYSRMPIYKGDIDHIVGVALAKDLLECMSLFDPSSSSSSDSIGSSSSSNRDSEGQHIAERTVVTGKLAYFL